eukprot:jgi/Phyca11/123502/e_gw1.50.305.1
MQTELKRDDAPKGKSTGGKTGGGKQPSKAAGKAVRTKVESKAPPNPPRTGCLICKGPHWAKDCPTGTDEQKQDIQREVQARKALRDERVKAVRVVRAGEGRRACINGVLDVPFCPDTGADSNIISRALVDELQGVGSTLKLQALEPVVQVQVAGGARVVCRDAVILDLRIETAAGPLHLADVPCLVMEGHEDEFLLGRKTMQDVGIDTDRLFDQLASGHVGDADADDVTSDNPQVAFSVDGDEVSGYLNKMVDAAGAAGLRQSCWRTYASWCLSMSMYGVFVLGLIHLQT